MKLSKVAQQDLEEFGRAVKRARSLRGWTLDQLAGSILPIPGKSFLCNIEKGKRDIGPLTVGKLIKALALPESWIDRFLNAEISPDAEETAQDRGAEKLLRMYDRDATAPQTAEDLLIGLAQDQAGQPFLDAWAAYAALKSMLEDAAALKAQGLLPSNTGDQLSIILRRVSDLNDQGLREEAGEALEDAIKRNDAEAEALFNAALKQDRIRNHPADAAARIIANMKRSAPPGGVFNATRDLIREWNERGGALCLLFDLKVALHLAKHNHSRAKGHQQRDALFYLGLCQARVGERSLEDRYLRAAVQRFTEFLKLITRGSDPLNWAIAQNCLGNVFSALGRRSRNAERLEWAVTAHSEALTEWNQAQNPEGWAIAKNNLGSALQALGELEGSTTRLELAIIVFSDVLKVSTLASSPTDWAIAQNNLGLALRWLGELTHDPAIFDRASSAYAFCLQERDRETTPFLWAVTQWNLADLALARFDLSPDQSLLATARSHALEAREVFAEGSDHQTAKCDALLAQIAAHEA